MTPETQYNRTIAHLNMTDEVHANCEECGAAIPVELTLCDDCVYAAEAGEPDHNAYKLKINGKVLPEGYPTYADAQKAGERIRNTRPVRYTVVSA